MSRVVSAVGREPRSMGLMCGIMPIVGRRQKTKELVWIKSSGLRKEESRGG